MLLTRLLLSPLRLTPLLLTPVLLIPFSGSGSEICAAILSGCWEEIVGIDFKQDYVDIAEARLAHWLNRPKQLELP